MLTYSIFDNGNLVVSFDEQGEAFAALQKLAAGSTDADALLLVVFDADGRVVDDAAPGERLPVYA